MEKNFPGCSSSIGNHVGASNDVNVTPKILAALDPRYFDKIKMFLCCRCRHGFTYLLSYTVLYSVLCRRQPKIMVRWNQIYKFTKTAPSCAAPVAIKDKGSGLVVGCIEFHPIPSSGTVAGQSVGAALENGPDVKPGQDTNFTDSSSGEEMDMTTPAMTETPAMTGDHPLTAPSCAATVAIKDKGSGLVVGCIEFHPKLYYGKF